MANRNGILNGVPAVIAELGPGNSLGVGLAGLISGAEKYYGLDVVKYSSSSETLSIRSLSSSNSGFCTALV